MTDQVNPVTSLVNGRTTVGAGEACRLNKIGKCTVQASVDGTGAVTATIPVYVSTDNVHWTPAIFTFSLSGTNTASDGFVLDGPWKFIRADLTAISGTNAIVNVQLSI